MLDVRKAPIIYNLKSKIWRPRRPGFTLIELLIVIALIGILASFSVVAFNKFQQMGRDARRKSDLDAISKALELAKSDSVGGQYYPDCPSPNDVCVLNSTNQTANPAIGPTYIKTVPADPKAGGGNCGSPDYYNNVYCYQSTPGGCTGQTGLSPCTSYTLISCLENANDNGTNVTHWPENVPQLKLFCNSLAIIFATNP